MEVVLGPTSQEKTDSWAGPRESTRLANGPFPRTMEKVPRTASEAPVEGLVLPDPDLC